MDVDPRGYYSSLYLKVDGEAHQTQSQPTQAHGLSNLRGQLLSDTHAVV